MAGARHIRCELAFSVFENGSCVWVWKSRNGIMVGRNDGGREGGNEGRGREGMKEGGKE